MLRFEDAEEGLYFTRSASRFAKFAELAGGMRMFKMRGTSAVNMEGVIEVDDDVFIVKEGA